MIFNADKTKKHSLIPDETKGIVHQSPLGIQPIQEFPGGIESPAYDSSRRFTLDFAKKLNINDQTDSPSIDENSIDEQPPTPSMQQPLTPNANLDQKQMTQSPFDPSRRVTIELEQPVKGLGPKRSSSFGEQPISTMKPGLSNSLGG